MLEDAALLYDPWRLDGHGQPEHRSLLPYDDTATERSGADGWRGRVHPTYLHRSCQRRTFHAVVCSHEKYRGVRSAPSHTKGD